jgi:putative ABC transport system permease protein
MLRALERAVLAWLRLVAPAGWADNVEGDFNEERDTGAPRTRMLVQAAGVAGRFTTIALAAWLRRRPRRTRGEFMSLFSDIRHAFRALRQGPGFSFVAVATLALAIGANTAIYSALSALVLRPLPFKDSHRFVYVWHQNPQMSGLMVAPPRKVIERWRSATHIFDAVESYTGKSLVITSDGEPEEVTVTFLRPSTLRTFGVEPAIGRPFDEADTAADAPPVVLISHALWTNRFGADPAIAGKTVTLADTPYTIVGVMPRRFRLPMASDAMWATVRQGTADDPDDSENTVARLAPGVTPEQAQASLDALATVPIDDETKGWNGRILLPADSNGTQIKTAIFVLTGAVGLLLLIACVNVANLMLSRHSGRRREIAVRHALGASHGRIIRYLMIESGLLAAAGGVAGLGVAFGGVSAMTALRPRNLDMLERLELDPGAMLVAAAITAVTVLLFGAGPAIAASRTDLQDALKTGGRSATAGGQRVRAALTIAQVSLALMLLVGATLLLKSYAKLTAVDPGYEPAGVLSVRVSLPASRYPVADKARRQAFFDEALASIAALPGVESAAAGNGVPPETGVMFGRLEVHGRSDEAKSGTFGGGYVTPDYFSTLGIPVLEGRVFSDEDTLGRDPVVVVGRTLATQFWPGERAIGKRLRTRSADAWSTVVGIVGDVKASDVARLQLYEPRAQVRPGFGSLIVRTSGDPLALVPAVKSRIWALDPKLAIGEIATAERLIARSTGQSRFSLALLASFAGCGLLLAVVGVYGVSALFVGQRQREIGIRMALGATRVAVASLVLRQTMLMLAVALATGVAGALWLSRYLQSLVFETATTDAVSFAAAAVAIAAASCAATLVPMRRATSVDPATVLRAE